MAQGLRRPERHSRQPSKVANTISRGNSNHNGNKSIASVQATTDHIKRVLCAPQSGAVSTLEPSSADVDNRPLSELLPSLTSSNEVDLQLYALVAVIIELFVQTWYSKITPDQAFVREVVQIIAHCTRDLERRLHDVDLECLLFDELPALLDAHISGTRVIDQFGASLLSPS
jgi:hypothetical protein